MATGNAIMLEQFSCTNPSEAASEWKKFRNRFENFITVYYEEVADKKKIAKLLQAGGEEINSIYSSFKLQDPDLATVIKKFDEHFLPKLKLTCERYKFLNRKQLATESFEQYVVVLKNLAETCELGDLHEDLTKDIFIWQMSSIWEKYCNKCKKRNHFSSVCKQVDSITYPNSENQHDIGEESGGHWGGL
ncbi:hypothetical protein ACJJTC_002192 [Scirpophaga incertulas]